MFVGFFVGYEQAPCVTGEANSSVTPHLLYGCSLFWYPRSCIILVYFILCGVLLHKVRTLFLGLPWFWLVLHFTNSAPLVFIGKEITVTYKFLFAAMWSFRASGDTHSCFPSSEWLYVLSSLCASESYCQGGDTGMSLVILKYHCRLFMFPSFFADLGKDQICFDFWLLMNTLRDLVTYNS